MRKLTVLASLLLLAPVVTQAQSLEDLLVQKGVITKSEAGSAHDMSGAKVYWNEGTRLDFADTGFTANIGTQFQTRYAFNDGDEDAGRSNVSSFDVRTARINVYGTALNEEFTYKIQTDFGGGTGSLKDAYLQWNACEGLGVRMGQFKTEFGRQQVNSISKLQFADRSAVTDFFTLGRQNGLAGMMDVNDDITLTAGIFNGLSDNGAATEGINSPGIDTKHTGVVALRADVMGNMDAYEEGDVNHTEDAALNVGLAYAYSEFESMPLATGSGATVNSVNADVNFKWQGWSAMGEFFWHEFDADTAADSIDNTGFYAQVGYFVMPKKLEIAGRYGYIDCDDGAAMSIGSLTGGDNVCAGYDKVNTVDASINYYWWKHHLKAQIGFEHLNQRGLGSADDVNDNTWLLQLSSWF